jgi:deoxyribodipyrimidine photolyase
MLLPLLCLAAVRTPAAAGMRELWATGWMQQSVRMVAAAFLTEYLNLPWTAGAAWFHDCLIDADLAINSMMWQNAGKSGL